MYEGLAREKGPVRVSFCVLSYWLALRGIEMSVGFDEQLAVDKPLQPLPVPPLKGG